MFANLRSPQSFEAIQLLAHLHAPVMPRAAQRAFDSANAAFLAGKLPPISTSRVQPRNSGGRPPANAPASIFQRWLNRKHPELAATAARQKLPPVGARASEFERYLNRKHPGLATNAAHARRVVNLGLKVAR